MTKMEKKSLDSSPAETITFEKGKVESAKVGHTTIGREPNFQEDYLDTPIAE
jgi:hypothetical protein